ncbi:MFS transporter [bacterium]|nr:MFS transporter [bacterium]
MIENDLPTLSTEAKQQPLPGRFQTGKVVTISLTHLLHDIYNAFLAPLLPLLIEKLSINYTLAGLLSVFQRAPALLNPFIGLLADRMSLRLLVVWTPTLTATCMSLIGLAPHYIVLALLLFVAGFSTTAFHVPSPVMIRQTAGQRLGMGMSFYMLGGELARALGPLVILGAVSLWGLSGTWRLLPAAVLASLLLHFKLTGISVSPGRQQREGDGAWPLLKKLTPMFSCIGGIILLRGMVKAALTLFLPTYLMAQGASIWLAGVALSLLQLSGALGTFLAGPLSDRIGRRNTLLIVTSAVPLLMWGFVALPSTWSLPLLVVIGFFLFGTGPVLLAIVHEVDSERPAFVNSLFMTVNFVGGSLTVLLVGLLGDALGLTLTYQLAAILALGAIPFALWFR